MPKGRPPSAKTLVDRQLGRNIKTPILPAGDSFVVPNHSGDHSEGRVDTTPTQDLDLVNKKYVDDNAGVTDHGLLTNVIASAHHTKYTDAEVDTIVATHTALGNAHHNESHNIASHSDTTATGAELDELTDGSETTLHSHAGGGGNHDWLFVEEIVITSAATIKDFAATLTGNTQGGYLMEFKMVNDSGLTATYSLRINTATWAGSRQFLLTTGTSVSAARDTATGFVQNAASGVGLISLTNVNIPFSVAGDERIAMSEGTHTGGNTTIRTEFLLINFGITTPAANVEITSLGVVCDQTNGIGVDSVMRLYKRE